MEREEHLLEDLPEEDHKIVWAPLTSVAFAIAPSWVHAAKGLWYLQLDKEVKGFEASSLRRSSLQVPKGLMPAKMLSPN